MAEWLLGNGCVPIYNLMEDAATAEISRTQIWQWVHHPKGILDDGRKVTIELFRSLMQEEMQHICKLVGDECFGDGKYNLAAQLFDDIISSNELDEFLTLRADANLAYEMYPDQRRYPSNSVPGVVKRINNVLRRADQIQVLDGRKKGPYWFAPLVADAEAGFGGC
jgi:isocitrate lyase